MPKTPTTVRLQVAAALLLLEAQLRDLPGARVVQRDRDAIRQLTSARINLTEQTDTDTSG